MKAKILKKRGAEFQTSGDVVEITIGGKTFYLYDRAADLYLEKKGAALLEIAFFRGEVEATILRIQ